MARDIFEDLNRMSDKRKFSIFARARSFRHAFRGVRIIFSTQHNAWVQLFATMVVICLGLWLKVSVIEWLILILSIFCVLTAEAFNTAMEIDMDLTSPHYHPYARDAKDVASGAVLLSAIGALIVGVIIFLPKIVILLKNLY